MVDTTTLSANTVFVILIVRPLFITEFSKDFSDFPDFNKEQMAGVTGQQMLLIPL